ncbi:MAG: hypothetical protein ACLGG0_13365 [Bacteriovoracia bacterium]
MKFVTLSLLICTSAFATGNHLKMKVIPLNSPVSEAAIIFKLEPPKGLAFVDVNARIKNQIKPPFRERIKDYPVEKSGDQILLKLPTRDYPVDKYEILVYTKNDNRKIWEFWKKTPPLAFGKAHFEVKTQQIIVDGDPQPPHPGEAGKETLLGIDSDNDGVRDDIEIWINERFAEQPSLLKGLKQNARALSDRMKNASNPPASILTTHKILRASACLKWIAGLDKGIEIRKELEFEFLNTKERIQAHMQAMKNFHGESGPEDMRMVNASERKIFCESQDVTQINQ